MAIRRATLAAVTGVSALGILLSGCTSAGGNTDSPDPTELKQAAAKNPIDPCGLLRFGASSKYDLTNVLKSDRYVEVETSLSGDKGARRTCNINNNTVVVETFLEAKNSTRIYQELVKQLKRGYNTHVIMEHDEVYPLQTSGNTTVPAPSPSVSSRSTTGYWLTNYGVREGAIFNVDLNGKPSYRSTVVITIHKAAKVSSGTFATMVAEARSDVYNAYIPDHTSTP